MYNIYDVHIFNVFNMYDVTSYLFATETETLTLTLTHILTSHKQRKSEVTYTDFWQSLNHTGIMYSACLPIHKSGTSFVGVVCIDILMRNLVEDLTSYPCFQHSSVAYSFMINSDGENNA